MSATAAFSPNPKTRLRRKMRGLNALRRDQDGVVAVEFGLVAVPFFALLFAILETALMFWSAQVLETAVANAARTIYTGQFQSANDQNAADIGAKFKAELCKNVLLMVTCDSPAVHVDVRPFKPGDILPKVNETGFGYHATKANEIVLVRVAIEYPIFVPALNALQANLANGKRLIMASATFRNEPF